MLRLQLAFALLFTLTLTHAITPIPPSSQDSASGSIIVAEPKFQGRITTPVVSAAALSSTLNPPKPGALADLQTHVNDAISALKDKAASAKKQYAPEIKALQEKEAAAEKALQSAQAQVALKLQPQLDKVQSEMNKVHSEMQPQLDQLRAGAAAAAAAVERKVADAKASLQPSVVQLQQAVSKAEDDISKRAAEAGQHLPDEMQQAKQSIEAAEQSLANDLKPVIDGLQARILPVDEGLQEGVKSAGEWFEQQRQQMQPWDAVEAEVRSDAERMSHMFADQLQQLQQASASLLPLFPPF